MKMKNKVSLLYNDDDDNNNKNKNIYFLKKASTVNDTPPMSWRLSSKLMITMPAAPYACASMTWPQMQSVSADQASNIWIIFSSPILEPVKAVSVGLGCTSDDYSAIKVTDLVVVALRGNCHFYDKVYDTS